MLSFSAQVIWVSCSAATPCASRARAKSRTSAAASASRATVAEARTRSTILRRLERCMPNKSRSEITPARRPSRVTTTWRIPWRTIASAASTTGASSSSAMTPPDIRLEIGASTSACGSATRSSTSNVVKMPFGMPSASATSIDPILSSCMVFSTSRTGVCGAQETGERGMTSRSGLSIPPATPSEASSRSARCDCSTSWASWPVQKVLNRGLRAISPWKSSAASSQQKQSPSDR